MASTDKPGNSRRVIAIPEAEGRLCMHFGHCQQFALFEVNPETGEVLGERRLEPPTHEPGALPAWLNDQGTNVIISGGMGMRAQQFFTQFGIEVIVGAPSVAPEEVVRAYLDGSLPVGDNICDH